MCGICGKLNFEGDHPVDRNLIDTMMHRIFHRGPDGGATFCSGPVGLGHRRLSIIDLSTGAQPMSNEDGTVWIVFNGEIYNFAALRAELQARGHKFKSTTDTEVIVHLYEEEGEASVKRLRGMFAFAIWDARKNRLFLARDRVGIKPLYYVHTGNAFLFASEIKALLADPSVFRRINYSAIDRFLTYYYLPGNQTLLDGIKKLEPGQYLTVVDGQIKIKTYWDLRFEPSPRGISFRDAVEALQTMLRQTVRDHMISDVPVGVLLSGGVDSTGVLRYAAEEAGSPIRTFTVGFSGAGFADERPYARLAAERYGTIHQDITISSKDFQAFLPDYVWHMEEPVCEPPAVALYFVSRLARNSSVKVLLSGEGGDEAFAGYQNYRNLLLLERMKSAMGPAKGLLQLGFGALAHGGSTRAQRYTHFVHPKHSEYYFSRTSSPATAFNREKRSLYRPDFAKLLGDHRADAPTRALFERAAGQSLLNQMLYVDTKTWLPDDLLIKADKMTMATSVELRVPLLDHQILEFAASLPSEFKVHRGSMKRILKAALHDSVPREILERRKTGFPVPYAAWLRREMKAFVHDTVLSPKAALADYFEKPALERLLQEHQSGINCSKEVFSLLVLELWHSAFLTSAPAFPRFHEADSLHPVP